MNKRAALSCVWTLALASLASADGPVTVEYSREGEISPGAAAPSQEAMVRAIENGSYNKLKATLEYGERVVCEACVPLLADRLLASDDAGVREMSAWWLRRQPFAAPVIMKSLRIVLKTDADAERRARAAEALGEFMDPHALAPLADAAREDEAPVVRAAAVRGLARLNHETAGPLLAEALADESDDVRRAALDVVLSVRSFREPEALIERLTDRDAIIRQRAARLCGEYRLAGARAALIALLRGDKEATVRKAAAWALGRVGGAQAKDALTAARSAETDRGVLGAIRIALRM